MEDLAAAIGAFLSIFCSIILIIVWIFNPKWRSLNNFISIHQVVYGTIHLCVTELLPDPGLNIFSALLPAMVCWTLCASVLAYIRLVILVPGKISYGKRKAAAFSYGTLAIVFVSIEYTVPSLFKLHENTMETAIAAAYFLMFMNLIVVLKVMSAILPCCTKRISSNGTSRMISLVGIAVMCDVITSLYLTVPFFDDLHYFYKYRLIPHTIVILFNKISIDYFKKRWKRRKQRANQASQFQSNRTV